MSQANTPKLGVLRFGAWGIYLCISRINEEVGWGRVNMAIVQAKSESPNRPQFSQTDPTIKAEIQFSHSCAKWMRVHVHAYLNTCSFMYQLAQSIFRHASCGCCDFRSMACIRARIHFVQLREDCVSALNKRPYQISVRHQD